MLSLDRQPEVCFLMELSREENIIKISQSKVVKRNEVNKRKLPNMAASVCIQGRNESNEIIFCDMLHRKKIHKIVTLQIQWISSLHVMLRKHNWATRDKA